MNIDLTLGAGIGAVTLQGHASIDVTDNSGNNTITGNMGDNVIEVTGGTDVAHGGLGTDRLFVDYSNATLSVIGTAVNITDGGAHAVTFDGFENFTIYTRQRQRYDHGRRRRERPCAPAAATTRSPPATARTSSMREQATTP